MQIRNYSPQTINNYLASVARISAHYGISPAKLTAEQIKDYLQKRIDSVKFSPSAVNQLLSALRILLVDVLGRKWETHDTSLKTTEMYLHVATCDTLLVQSQIDAPAKRSGYGK